MRYWFVGIPTALADVIAVVWIVRSQDAPAPRAGTSTGERVIKTDAEWQAILTAEQFHVTRQKGTELAWSGQYAKSKDDGVFMCVCCGQPLFDAKAKYESGTGWPSFWQPIDPDNVSLVPENTVLSRRTEVICSRCDAHLGHVFNDGPRPTGLRYCINSASLNLVKREN